MGHTYTYRFQRDGRLFDYVMKEIKRIEGIIGKKPFMIAVDMEKANEFSVYVDPPEDDTPHHGLFLNGVRIVVRRS